MESTALVEGTKEDLHNIWDALEPTGFIQVMYKVWWCDGRYVEDRVGKQNGEEAWMELEEILNVINEEEEEEEEEDTFDSEEEEEDDDEEEEEDEDDEEAEDLEEEGLGPVH